MLLGSLEHGARPQTVAAIEIDPWAGNECEQRLQPSDGSTTVLIGDAFVPAMLNLLPSRSWDLVITNPPYVRYQSTAQSAGTTTKLPSALQIRHNLIESIEGVLALNLIDRHLLQRTCRWVLGARRHRSSLMAAVCIARPTWRNTRHGRP